MARVRGLFFFFSASSLLIQGQLYGTIVEENLVGKFKTSHAMAGGFQGRGLGMKFLIWFSVPM